MSPMLGLLVAFVDGAIVFVIVISSLLFLSALLCVSGPRETIIIDVGVLFGKRAVGSQIHSQSARTRLKAV